MRCRCSAAALRSPSCPTRLPRSPSRLRSRPRSSATAAARAMRAASKATPSSFNDRLGQAEADFIAAQRSFYMATVSETGWPYLQHRGGPRGFLQGAGRQDPGLCRLRRQPAADQRRQPGGQRPRRADPGGLRAPRAAEAAGPAGSAGPGGAGSRWHGPWSTRPTARGRSAPWSSRVEGFDWNCPQHIPVRIDAEDVQRALDERDARIAELKHGWPAAAPARPRRLSRSARGAARRPHPFPVLASFAQGRWPSIARERHPTAPEAEPPCPSSSTATRCPATRTARSSRCRCWACPTN